MLSPIDARPSCPHRVERHVPRASALSRSAPSRRARLPTACTCRSISVPAAACTTRWRDCSIVVQGVGFDADAEECARSERPTATACATSRRARLEGRRRGHAVHHRFPGSSSLLDTEPVRYSISFSTGSPDLRHRPTAPVTLTTLRAPLSCAHEIDPRRDQAGHPGRRAGRAARRRTHLSQALLVESEVEFQSLYVGQPLFRDIDAFMAGKGWALLGLRRDFWRRTTAPSADGGTLAHGDVLYPEPGAPRVGHRRERRPILATLAAYRQADYVKILATRVGRPEWVGDLVRQASWTQRLVGSVLSRLGTHRAWRAWLDGCRAPRRGTDSARRRLLLTTACAAARADRRPAARSPSTRPPSTVARGRGPTRAPRARARRPRATRCGRTIGVRR